MKKILALGALVSLGMSSAALADGALADNSAQGVQGGAYIGGGLGIGGMNTPKSYLPLGKGVANLKQSRKLRSGVTYRVDAGYLFPVTSHLLLGAEVGYTGYPQNKYNQDGDFWLKTKVHTRLNYSGHMFDVLGVAKYYFGNHFNVFAKAGAADVYQKTSFNMYETGDKQQVVDSIAFTKKVNKILPEAAVGGEKRQCLQAWHGLRPITAGCEDSRGTHCRTATRYRCRRGCEHPRPRSPCR